MFNAHQTGLAIGIAIGLIITVIVLKLVNKDGKMRTEYDEMQKIARGEAYRYGFWAFAICECILLLLTSGKATLPAEPFVLHFGVILVGVIVQVSYSIWHNAYIGLNTNPGKFAVFAVIISAFNFFIGIMAIVRGGMVVDGMLQAPAVNILCGVLFIIIGVEIFLKMEADRNKKEE